jgi:hypothetical protein
MRGPDFERPSPEIIAILRKGSTASYTTIFSRVGIRDLWMPKAVYLLFCQSADSSRALFTQGGGSMTTQTLIPAITTAQIPDPLDLIASSGKAESTITKHTRALAPFCQQPVNRHLCLCHHPCFQVLAVQSHSILLLV